MIIYVVAILSTSKILKNNETIYPMDKHQLICGNYLHYVPGYCGLKVILYKYGLN